MKKLLSVFLALIMVFAMCTGALADETVQDLDGQVVIVHTNDVHGSIDTYAKAAALVDEYEARGADVLLVDDGDFSQGSVYVNGSAGANAITLMNAAGYDVATLGNHEFDYGWENIAKLDDAADFPIISNVKRNGEYMLPQTVVLSAGDFKVGFFGLETPETATKAHPAKIQGVTFMSGEELYKYAADQVAALTEQDVDYIVCLGHLGISGNYTSIDLLQNVEGIDLFIDGHSENTIAEIAATAGVGQDNKVGDTVVTSAGSKGDHIGAVILNGDEITISDVVTADYTETDATVAAAAEAIKTPIDSEMNEVFAKTEVTLNGERAPGNRTGETNLGDLIADAFRWYALEQGDLGVDEDHVVALTNGGGIRATVEAGDITMKDINTVLPFGNTVAYITVKGSVLLEALEASTYSTPEELGAFPQVAGIEFTVDTTKEYDAGDLYPGSTYYAPASINRVTIDSINGKAFDPDATYVVVSNDFTAAGGDTYYAFSVSESVDTGAAMDTVVVDYITEVLDGVVTAEQYGEPQGRITVLTEAAAEPGFFTDVAEGAWYYDYIVTAYENGLMTGVSETEFAPDVAVTRAMLVAMVYQLEGSPEVEGAASELFTDVADDAWYADALVWCSANGLLEGFEGETFDADTVITREDVAVMLYAYELYNGAEEVTDAELTWADAADVSEDAVAAVAYCTESGLMNGVTETEFAPDGSATRAQCATVLVRLFEAASEEAAA